MDQSAMPAIAWRAKRRQRQQVGFGKVSALQAPEASHAHVCLNAVKSHAFAGGGGESKELKITVGLAAMFVGWYGANIYFNM